MAINQFSPLAQFETSLRAFTGALSSILDSFHEPQKNKSFKQILLQPVPSQVQSKGGVVQRFWQNDDSNAEPGRPDRSTSVRLKIKELRRLSSPTRPICFRCGDKGHIASQCRNAVLCFTCNRFGHRSLRCQSLTELSFQTPTPNPQLDPPINSDSTPPTPPNTLITSDPSHLTLPDAGFRSGLKSAPVYYEMSVMDSIKRLEMELAEIKQEVTLMKTRGSEMYIAMAGIKAQIHRNQSKLAEIEAAKAAQRSAIREEQQRDDEIGTGICSINKGKDPMCSEEMVHAIATARQQEDITEIQIESINKRRPVANLPLLAETVTGLDVNRGFVGDARKGTLHRGSLRPTRSLRLRVQGLSV